MLHQVKLWPFESISCFHSWLHCLHAESLNLNLTSQRNVWIKNVPKRRDRNLIEPKNIYHECMWWSVIDVKQAHWGLNPSIHSILIHATMLYNVPMIRIPLGYPWNSKLPAQTTNKNSTHKQTNQCTSKVNPRNCLRGRLSHLWKTGHPVKNQVGLKRRNDRYKRGSPCHSVTRELVAHHDDYCLPTEGLGDLFLDL